MAKKKMSKMQTILVAIVALLVGTIVAFVGSIYLSLPDSYAIPQKVAGTVAISNVGLDSHTIKSGDLSIHFLELANKYTGDCTLIKVGETEVLIDAGSKASSIPYIKEYLDQYVDGALDFVVVTHAHEDHYAGFATNNSTDSLFDLFNVGIIIEFAQTNQTVGKKLYDNYVRERNEAVSRGAVCFTALECVNETKNAAGIPAQKEYVLGTDVTMTILYQTFYEAHATTENNYSVCLQINQQVVDAEPNRYLFTGDLEKKGEASLVTESLTPGGKNYDLLGKTKLFKAGHHGSKTSSNTVLLDVIRPEIVCVCCCAGSSEYTSNKLNQFPTQEFIDRVAQYTDQVYVTSLCVDYAKGQFTAFNGTIVLQTKANNAGTELSVLMFFTNNDTKLKDSEWFQTNRTWPETLAG